MWPRIIINVIANCFGSKFAEASCLGEHGVAVSGKKKFISGRSYLSPSLTKFLLKRNLPLGLGCDMLHLDKNASARKLSRIVIEMVK